MPGTHRVSIYTLAQELGLSHNTVALTLRHSPRVRDRTRRRVLTAARRLGYRPNLLARAVVTGRSQLLAVLVPEDAFVVMPRLFQGLQDAAGAGGYGLLFMTYTPGDESGLRGLFNRSAEHRVEGVVVVPPDPVPSNTLRRAVKEAALRAVYLLCATWPAPSASAVEINLEEAGHLALDRLAAQGHRRFAYLGPRGNAFAALRRKGVELAAREVGGRALYDWVAGDESSVKDAAVKLRGLPAHKRPTAVVCYLDVLAAEFVREALAQGLRVPEDVSVVGMGDHAAAVSAAVPLSSLRAPERVMGAEAARLLLAPPGEAPLVRRLSWTWIERRSTGPAPG